MEALRQAMGPEQTDSFVERTEENQDIPSDMKHVPSGT